MKLTKKEIKLIIKTFEQHKDNLESEWSVELMVEEKDFLNKLYEAINYTHCCEPFFCADEKQNGSNQRCEKQCDSGCKD
tara:strand:+ start:355 stop:591 length:237 start_codon:yes stop_codon:yes gene_type:complete